MRMTFRWYGEKDDKITLQQIDQIPGMDGIVGALFDIPVGEVWPVEPLLHIKQQAEANNLVFKDLESINVHEDINWACPAVTSILKTTSRPCAMLPKPASRWSATISCPSSTGPDRSGQTPLRRFDGLGL